MAVRGREVGEPRTEVGRLRVVGHTVQQPVHAGVEVRHDRGSADHGPGDGVEVLGVLGRLHVTGRPDQVGHEARLAGGGAGVGQHAGHDRGQRRRQHVVVEGRSEGDREGVEVGQQVLVGGVQLRAERPVGVGLPVAVGDHRRHGPGPQRPQDGLQDLEGGQQALVALPGHVGRRITLAEEGHVDGLRRRGGRPDAKDPQVREVEVCVAAVEADDHRVVTGEVALPGHAQLRVGVPPGLLGGDHAQPVGEGGEDLGKHLADVAPGVDGPTRIDLSLDDPRCAHGAPVSFPRASQREAGLGRIGQGPPGSPSRGPPGMVAGRLSPGSGELSAPRGGRRRTS